MSQLQPPLFYCHDLTDTAVTAVLQGDEASHAIKSRRLRIGDDVQLTNGLGLLGYGSIKAVNQRPAEVRVSVNKITLRPLPNLSVILASALPKGDRQSVMLDMAIQLGIARFVPLDCHFSSVKFQHKMTDRWSRIIQSTCKQSRRCYFPEILPPSSPSRLIGMLKAEDIVIYGDPDGGSIEQIARQNIQQTNNIIAMVGPEGGFDPIEHNLLKQHPRAFNISIGHHILRTETAAIALLSAITAVGQKSV